MFHRKHSAGTKQKDKFRHRKAIHRIVSRPHNLKFPGGHDYGHEIEMYTVEQGEKRDKRQ